MWVAVINFVKRIAGYALGSSPDQVTGAKIAPVAEIKLPAVAGYIRRADHLRVIGEPVATTIATPVDRHLPARLASVAQLNLRAGRSPRNTIVVPAANRRPKAPAGTLRKRQPSVIPTPRFAAAPKFIVAAKAKLRSVIEQAALEADILKAA